MLFAHAAEVPALRILSRTSVFAYEQNDAGALAKARDLDTNEDLEIFARYLIGCDGAHSNTRRRIGATFSGNATVVEVQSTYLRAPHLLGMMPGPAWAIDVLNPRSCGLMFAIDGREQWLIHNFLQPGQSASSVDRDRSVREILGVGPGFELGTCFPCSCLPAPASRRRRNG